MPILRRVEFKFGSSSDSASPRQDEKLQLAPFLSPDATTTKERANSPPPIEIIKELTNRMETLAAAPLTLNFSFNSDTTPQQLVTLLKSARQVNANNQIQLTQTKNLCWLFSLFNLSHILSNIDKTFFEKQYWEDLHSVYKTITGNTEIDFKVFESNEKLLKGLSLANLAGRSDLSLTVGDYTFRKNNDKVEYVNDGDDSKPEPSASIKGQAKYLFDRETRSFNTEGGAPYQFFTPYNVPCVLVNNLDDVTPDMFGDSETLILNLKTEFATRPTGRNGPGVTSSGRSARNGPGVTSGPTERNEEAAGMTGDQKKNMEQFHRKLVDFCNGKKIVAGCLTLMNEGWGHACAFQASEKELVMNDTARVWNTKKFTSISEKELPDWDSIELTSLICVRLPTNQ